jgi:hypothetical protein
MANARLGGITALKTELNSEGKKGLWLEHG